jgi:hypothetical protein
LIGKGKQDHGEKLTAVPAWMGKGQAQAAPPETPLPRAAPSTPESEAPVAETPAPVPVQDQVIEAGDQATVDAAPLVVGEMILTTHGGQLRLSLTHNQGIIAGVAAVLILAVAFMLGRAAAPSVPAVGGKAERPPAAPAVLKDQPSQKATVKANVPVGPTEAARNEQPQGKVEVSQDLEKGKYYLIVQGLMGNEPAHLKDAEAITKFCNEQGEPVKVFKLSDQYVVLSLTPFALHDSVEAKKFAQAIENLGKAYMAEHGKYNFKQRGGWWYQAK